MDLLLSLFRKTKKNIKIVMKKIILRTILFTVLFFVTSALGAQTEKLTLKGSMGNISAVIQKPVLKPGRHCPMVMILHGFGGNKNEKLLTLIADSLLSHGVASIRFDFNGHGESDGDFQNMTVPNEIEDAKCVYQYVSALPYVSVVGMAGHSQGGVVTSMTAGELGNKIKCIVLLAPAAVLRDDAIRGNTMGKMYDPLNPPEYVELWGGKKLGRNYIQTAFSLPIYETSARYRGRACIIHGTGDRVVPYTYGERYHQILKKSVLHILAGFDHGFSQNIHRAADMATDYLIRVLK